MSAAVSYPPMFKKREKAQIVEKRRNERKKVEKMIALDVHSGGPRVQPIGFLAPRDLVCPASLVGIRLSVERAGWLRMSLVG